MTPLETLQHIQDRLASESPRQIIDVLLPQTDADAVTWARRLSGWEEHPFPPQVIGLARVISRRAMREHGLRLTAEGRVVRHEAKGRQVQRPKRSFRLAINGEDIQVEYTPDYFPDRETDLFSFVGPQPHCLSDTGHLGQFVPRDVVDACGGPEAFAGQFAQAQLQGQDFLAAFQGQAPEAKRSRRQPAREQAVGEHTARVIEEAETLPATAAPSVQRMLF